MFLKNDKSLHKFDFFGSHRYKKQDPEWDPVHVHCAFTILLKTVKSKVIHSTINFSNLMCANLNVVLFV